MYSQIDIEIIFITDKLNINTKTKTVMEQLIQEIKAAMDAVKADIDKVDNASARARVRKATLQLEKLGKEYRKQSVAYKK